MPPDSLSKSRRSIRLSGYDYSQAGAYFVTICAKKRNSVFGEISGDEMNPNAFGNIVIKCWMAIPQHFGFAELDEFVLMPNHIHGILVLADQPGRGTIYRALAGVERFGDPTPDSLPTIIRTFKAAATRQINRDSGPLVVWQRGYYEHVIRDEKELNRIRQYIVENPLKWATDRENPAVP